MRTYGNTHGRTETLSSAASIPTSVCAAWGRTGTSVCSGFEYFPRVPLFRGRDLAHWRQVSNVLDRPGWLGLGGGVIASVGIYAPTLPNHAGRFYLITTGAGSGGTFPLRTDRPGSPRSHPVRIDLPGTCYSPRAVRPSGCTERRA